MTNTRFQKLPIDQRREFITVISNKCLYDDNFFNRLVKLNLKFSKALPPVPVKPKK